MENFWKVQNIMILDIASNLLVLCKVQVVITCIIISMYGIACRLPTALSCLQTMLRCPLPPPCCIWQSWSQAPAIPGWLAWLRGKLVWQATSRMLAKLATLPPLYTGPRHHPGVAPHRSVTRLSGTGVRAGAVAGSAMFVLASLLLNRPGARPARLV